MVSSSKMRVPDSAPGKGKLLSVRVRPCSEDNQGGRRLLYGQAHTVLC